MKPHIFGLLWFIFSSLLYALSPTQIEQLKNIQNNPALVNTMISNRQPDILLNSTLQNRPQNNRPQNYIQKPIIISENNVSQIVNKKQELNISIKRLNPFEYKTNEELLTQIKSIQFKNSRNKLERFSAKFFRNQNQINPNHIVVPPDYIINKGDTITFWIYGATNMQHELVVDKRGNINIPQVGPVHVAGEKFKEVQELLVNYLSSSYKNSQVVVDLNSFSTAQITVTGYVNSPGIYNTTSVTSIKDVLIQAGGVSDIGSVRRIQLYRNNNLIETIDYYHLLALGQDHGDTVIQSGDIIHIPKAYGLISIYGEVNTPAIYEIEPSESLTYILKFAGGLKAVANGKRIHIKRYSHNNKIIYKTLTLSQARHFIVKDGDEIYIGKLTPADEQYVEFIGNVVDPGKKYIGSHSIKLSRLLKKELKGNNLSNFFLENTDFNYALIKRIDKNLQTKTYNINLHKILLGEEDFLLQNKDKIYIFNILDTKINPYITIVDATTRKNLQLNEKLLKKIHLSDKIDQELQQSSFDKNNTFLDINLSDRNISDVYINKVNRIILDQNLTDSAILLKPGKYTYTKGMTLQDIIKIAGIKKPFDQNKVKIVSRDLNTGNVTIKIINYKKYPNYKLHPFDTIHLFDLEKTHPIPMATIDGEVVSPGEYEVPKGTTLNQLINSAGGLTERAYPKECEVIRYYIKNGERKKKIFHINLKDKENFIVQAFDEINIKRIPYWYEKKEVTLKGEVKFPGTYVIHTGEKLSSVIERAGGFTQEAFVYGAVFTRKEIAELQKKSLARSLSKLKEQVILASLRASGSKTMGQISINEGIKAVQSLIDEAEKLTPIGRISINLPKDINKLKNSPSDLTLKDGDTLTIPSHNDTVVVSGEVMNPMALTYLGKNIRDYINRTGGLTEVADSDHIYVLHANGEAQKASLGSYLFASNNVYVKRGDVIIVPKKIMFERGIDIAGDIADIIYKLTLTVAAMNTVGVL